MNERTQAFLLGGITVVAWVIFWNGLIRAASANHPDSKTGAAFLALT